MENRRKFRLADVILSVICVVFVAEAAAPVASIGNSQYFWWLFMIAAFLLPYGLIASELGTAFPGDGGLYDWIQTAYPDPRWGARASWYYWINFPLWMASLAVVCPELLEVIFGGRIDPVWSLVIQLAFIWIVTWIAAYPVCDSILILNLSAAIKIRPNVASLSIRTLEDRNLITRVPNPKDRRAANVTLSRKGARFVHATKGELIDIFDSCYPALAERETLEFFPA